MVSLAVRYRPQTFQEIIGQPLTSLVLQRRVEAEDLPPGLLFAGPSGTGKTTAARVLATALDADVTEIDAASHGGVDSIRAILDSLRYGVAKTWRVIIIDEAHSVTRDGFNALLKTLEEPPPGVVFVLCSTEPEKIPVTVLSRMIEFEFRRVSPAEILDRLVEVVGREGWDVPQPFLVDIASRAEGSVRQALMLLDHVHTAGIVSQEQYDSLLGVQDVGPKIVAAMYLGNIPRLFEIVDEELQTAGSPQVIASQVVRVFRDLLVLRAGGEVLATGPALAHRRDLAGRIEPERVFKALRILWDLKTRVRASDDPRGNLDLTLMLVAEALTAGRQAPAPTSGPPTSPAPQPERRMSLQEMREKAR